MLKNWAGNLTYATSNVSHPKTIEDVIRIVKQSDSIRCLGSRHSFNTIANSQSELISLHELTATNELSADPGSIRVSAGIRYGDICKKIDDRGFALHNLASLPHISVAGACATSTHGSGIKNESLTSAAISYDIITAAGELITISKNKDSELFHAIAVHLGTIGIICNVELELQTAFDMDQYVYRNLPLSELEQNFLDIMSAGYSVSLFTDWMNGSVNQVWIKNKVDGSPNMISDRYFGAVLADRDMHPLENHSALSCTEQKGLVGKWYDRLPHFKMAYTPSSGEELQAEYFVPLEYGYQAMKAVEQINDQIFPHLFISEIRTIAADNFWMSPFYKKACVSIHFTFKPHWEAVQKLVTQIEEVLDIYHVRPHWGKLFAMRPQILQSRIEKLDDFKTVMRDFDPHGKFRNDFINTNLFA